MADKRKLNGSLSINKDYYYYIINQVYNIEKSAAIENKTPEKNPHPEYDVSLVW